MIYVPPLHTELMSTTALTPTHHGGFIRAVASIAVAIAIPVFAPEIAFSIGLTGVIGNIAASAVVGGAIGALAAKVTGGDWKMGLAGGAITGGIGGFAKAGGFSGIGGSRIPGGSAGDFAGLSAAQLGGTPAAATSSTGLITGTAPGSSVGGFDAFGNISYGDPYGQAGFVAADPALSFIPPSPPASPVPFDLASGPDQFGVNRVRVSLQSPTGAPSATSSVTPSATPSAAPDSGFVYDYPTQSWTASDAGLATAARASAVTPTAGDAVGGFVSDVGDRIIAGITPERVQQGLGQLATSAFAEAFADKAPVTPEEDRLRGARDEARANQTRLLGLREDAAGDFLREARNINPVYSGQQALTEEQNRLARTQQAGLRRINPRDTGAVQTYQRQAALNRSRLGGFARAYDARTQERERKLAQGIGLLPTGSALATGAAADIEEADKRYKRMQEQQVAAGGIFSTFLGDLGTDTEEERKKRGKGITSAPLS